MWHPHVLQSFSIYSSYHLLPNTRQSAAIKHALLNPPTKDFPSGQALKLHWYPGSRSFGMGSTLPGGPPESNALWLWWPLWPWHQKRTHDAQIKWDRWNGETWTASTVSAISRWFCWKKSDVIHKKDRLYVMVSMDFWWFRISEHDLWPEPSGISSKGSMSWKWAKSVGMLRISQDISGSSMGDQESGRIWLATILNKCTISISISFYIYIHYIYKYTHWLYLSIYLSIDLSIDLSINLSIGISIDLSIYLSFSIYLSIYLSI